MGTARDTAVLRQAASLLLAYPDADFRERLPLVEQGLRALPGSQARDALLGLCRHTATESPLDLGMHYVEAFDMRGKRTPHMTFYLDGDTRRRGHTLAAIKEIYTGCGWELSPRELPDHLAVILEFAARGDAEWGETLLHYFRPGLDLLGAALHEYATPYAAVLDAVRATLPPPGPEQEEAVRRLARLGPPAEAVGLDGYGGPVDLGMPGVGSPVNSGILGGAR
ncbi:nitrate reductase molybdenum cofactor assembly chaperone [Marinactinospora thermotolerans]|uniref:nitrate reductase molybdenum cofactor assembly chaperone n=1 Tax=Marinactinospora thermotolerans TaxID=531310 RepID=UPI0009998F49|nr:nitrate reductase molybdenum cofactor assembly chaperone [Marinactinospora thermotolerans]